MMQYPSGVTWLFMASVVVFFFFQFISITLFFKERHFTWNQWSELTWEVIPGLTLVCVLGWAWVSVMGTGPFA